MNRISKTEDLSDLVGKIVEQVCFGPHQVILNLEDHCFISLEGAFSFAEKRDGIRSVKYMESADAFTKLIGHKIKSADVISEDALEIRFTNGQALQVFDSNERYESFQIKLSNRLIVV
jgi:hypothetical protein